MARTVAMEEWPADTQRIVEDLLSSGEPIYLSREGQRVGEFKPYSDEDVIDEELTLEEKAEIKEIVLQGRAEIAAGRYMTREEFLARNAHKLQTGKK